MKGVILPIQFVRAIAALLVALLHAEHEIGELAKGIAIHTPLYLGIGVDLFFVVSGFIMTITTKDYAPGWRSGVEFFRRRMIRVLPLYWIFTTLMIAVILLVPSRISNGGLSFFHILYSYLLIPHVHPSALTYEPVLRVGWTLIYEFMFYILFALALLVKRTAGLVFVAVVLFALVLIGLVNSPAGVWSFFTHSIAFEFVFGIGIALLWLRGSIKPGVVVAAAWIILSILAYLVFYAYLGLGYKWRLFYAGIPAGLFILGMLHLPVSNDFRTSWPGRLFEILGNSSYSLYLSHMFVIGAAKVVFQYAKLTPGLVYLYAWLAVVAAAIFSVVCYYVVEAPMTRALATRRST